MSGVSFAPSVFSSLISKFMEQMQTVVQSAALELCRRHSNSTSSGTFMYLQDIQFGVVSSIQAGGKSKKNSLDSTIK